MTPTGVDFSFLDFVACEVRLVALTYLENMMSRCVQMGKQWLVIA